MTHRHIEPCTTAHGLIPPQFNNTRNQFIDNLIVANGKVFITHTRNESAGVTLIRISRRTNTAPWELLICSVSFECVTAMCINRVLTFNHCWH